MRKKFEYVQVSLKVAEVRPSTILYIHKGANKDDKRDWQNVHHHFWSINLILNAYGSEGWVLRNQDSSPPDKKGHITLRYTFGRTIEE